MVENINVNIDKLNKYFKAREHKKLLINSKGVYLDYVNYLNVSKEERLTLVFMYRGILLTITIRGYEDDKNLLSFTLSKKVRFSTIIKLPVSNFSVVLKDQLEGFIEKVDSGEINELKIDFEWEDY